MNKCLINVKYIWDRVQPLFADVRLQKNYILTSNVTKPTLYMCEHLQFLKSHLENLKVLLYFCYLPSSFTLKFHLRHAIARSSRQSNERNVPSYGRICMKLAGTVIDASELMWTIVGTFPIVFVLVVLSRRFWRIVERSLIYSTVLDDSSIWFGNRIRDRTEVPHSSISVLQNVLHPTIPRLYHVRDRHHTTVLYMSPYQGLFAKPIVISFALSYCGMCNFIYPMIP